VEWSKHLKEEANISDRYLQGLHEEEKASLVSQMMLQMHKQNRRGKAATAFTAAIRLEFAERRLSITFLDSALVSTARSSCKMTPAELREKRNSKPTHTVKLPFSENTLADMRSRLWDNLSWSDQDKEKRMRNLGCKWGYGLRARVEECTRAEPGKSDHCMRLDDLTFIVEGATVAQTLSGCSLIGTGAENSAAVLRQIAPGKSHSGAGPYGMS
jgi:hypothetical protein